MMILCTEKASTVKILLNNMQTISMTLLFVSAIPTITGLRKLWEFDNFITSERVMKIILESCHEHDRWSGPIVIFGDFNQVIDDQSVIRMNNFVNINQGHEHDRFLDYKASRIVFIENSPEQLKSDLILFKKTRWWNHMASFFIIGKNSKKCGDLEDMLIATWKMNIINSIYICSESRNTTALYTLNPITNYAPHPWKRVEMRDKLHIFRQVFDANILCRNLNYDKTKFLNGYIITVAFWRLRRKDAIHANNLTTLLKTPLLHSVSKALNATLMFEEIENTLTLDAHFDDGSSDIAFAPHSMEFLPDLQFLFPHRIDWVIAVVKSREMTTLQKIYRLWSPQVLLLASIALVILLSVLTMKNENFIIAVLDIIRFLTYVSIYTNNRNHSFRIYFTTMLIFIVISNGVFQGKIAAFLTKPERIPIGKTISDLKNSGYKFYAEPYGQVVMDDQYPEFVSSLDSPRNCIGHVLNDTLSACILTLRRYELMYNLLPLEDVEKPVSMSFWNYKCRHDWPLHDRVNHMLMRAFQSGLPAFLDQKATYLSTHKRREIDMELSRSRYRPVKLAKLDFALELLIIGLSFAMIVFFLEIVIAKYSSPRNHH